MSSLTSAIYVCLASSYMCVYMQCSVIVHVYVYRLLDWRERRGGEVGQQRTKADKVVIFRHLFHPKEFEVSHLQYWR